MNFEQFSITMPHSTSPEPSSRLEEEDGVLPDAPPAEPSQDEEAAGSDRSTDAVMYSVEVATDSSKMDIKLDDMFDDDEDEDEEFPSSGLPANGKVETMEARKDPSKIEVKLEDLFDDDEDEDEEFPNSSVAANGKLESSPPAAASL